MRPILALIASTFLFTASAFAADGRGPVEPPQRLPDVNTDAAEPAEPARPARPTPPTAEQLLERLSKAENPRDARAIEQQLHALWSRSGSATADLLLQRSEKALEEEDLDTAQALLEKLTELAPKFAEGWYPRAAIAARNDNFEDAVSSLRQVLALQPKHFVALAELGVILEDFGDKQRALEAYRQAQTLNPHIEGIEDRIRELSREVEGQGI
jgi:tetratricopeptide (TPR) repeat protein